MKTILFFTLCFSSLVYWGAHSQNSLSQAITKNIVLLKEGQHAYASTHTSTKAHAIIFHENTVEPINNIPPLAVRQQQIWHSLTQTLNTFPTHTEQCIEGKRLLKRRLSHAQQHTVTLSLARQWTGYLRQHYCRALPPTTDMIPQPV